MYSLPEGGGNEPVWQQRTITRKCVTQTGSGDNIHQQK